MKMSNMLVSTLREVPAEAEIDSHKLMLRAGMIRKMAAGIYNYMPLGLKALKNVEEIVREEMNAAGAQEFLASAMLPAELWQESGRWDVYGAEMFRLKDRNNRDYCLGPTHEEVFTDIARTEIKSYKQLPVNLYQIQTKFRNEARPKSGLLRGREFRMKDLYSFHQSEEGLLEFYEIMKREYMLLFENVGLAEDTFITLAEGGDFTKEFSHEFQTLIPQGEDTIFLDRVNRIAYNKEIVSKENEKRLGVKFDNLEQVSASEVGNIFPLNLKFSNPFNLTYTTKDGSVRPVYMGCYGLGTSRLMGVIAEKFADEKGLVWPERIAPAKFHIVTVSRGRKGEAYELSQKIFNLIGKDALWDRRIKVSVGQKLNDADLIGCPYRIIISSKSIEKGGVAIKQRKLEKEEYMTIEELINKYGGVRKS